MAGSDDSGLLIHNLHKIATLTVTPTPRHSVNIPKEYMKTPPAKSSHHFKQPVPSERTTPGLGFALAVMIHLHMLVDLHMSFSSDILDVSFLGKMCLRREKQMKLIS